MVPGITHKEVSYEIFGTQGFHIHGVYEGSFTTHKNVDRRGN